MNLISLLLTILVLALIFGLIWWVLGQIPIPDPFRMIVNVIFGIICIIVLLGMLTGTVNVPMLKLG